MRVGQDLQRGPLLKAENTSDECEYDWFTNVMPLLLLPSE
jgi:hypothetical protein